MPSTGLSRSKRLLVAIPAYNESATILEVLQRVKACLPEVDVLVVNDGSTDSTDAILKKQNILYARHMCNLGYGRAVQTALQYANHHGYYALLTLDADLQHDPSDLRLMLKMFEESSLDLLIGSRWIAGGVGTKASISRRLGMSVFSFLVRALSGQRIHDTTSGMRIMRSTIFDTLLRWTFVDCHAEIIVYLICKGWSVGECPIRVVDRRCGTSMYSITSHVAYPLKTGLMVLLAALVARLETRRVQ